MVILLAGNGGKGLSAGCLVISQVGIDEPTGRVDLVLKKGLQGRIGSIALVLGYIETVGY